ncbi:hypothetical protein [Olivibacter sitiensis]|uniref:hypothetical protein n=1 Tax=Olivibacter sitiensis TaxID=376470 RepID=UPI00041893C5|nr:hypothetical protein [Olivibacter sitiensis]
MKKSYFLGLVMACAISFGLTERLAAQSPVKLSIGLEGGIPTGDASDIYSAAGGVSLNVRVPLPLTNLDVIGSVGYQQWFVKGDFKDTFENLGFNISNFGFLPIKAGLRYGFGFTPLYVKFDLGPAITIKEAIEGGDSGTAMTYSPGLGAKLGPLEAELKYDIYSKDGTQSFVGLKLSYYLF